MNLPEDKSGIMLQCSQSGQIIRVIRDDLGITEGMSPATTFFDIVDPESSEKAQDFFRAALAGRATFDWEINVPSDGTSVGLLLMGGRTDDTIVICGSFSRAGLNKLFDAMMEIQNEQLNTLRTSLKEQQLTASIQQQREQAMLGDFTGLNNELVNLQRELARRNADLADANARLESLATTDGLTGLKNHRAFQEALEGEWTRAMRYDTSLSLMMMDVDQFKQFNDQFGHPAGDEVLKRVSRILTGESRSESLVARYGGEEFAVILPNSECDDAVVAAERVRLAVEAGPWVLRAITASIGVATRLPGMSNRAALIVQADAAMYRAKVSGRNRVCRDDNVPHDSSALSK